MFGISEAGPKSTELKIRPEFQVSFGVISIGAGRNGEMTRDTKIKIKKFLVFLGYSKYTKVEKGVHEMNQRKYIGMRELVEGILACGLYTSFECLRENKFLQLDDPNSNPEQKPVFDLEIFSEVDSNNIMNQPNFKSERITVSVMHFNLRVENQK